MVAGGAFGAYWTVSGAWGARDLAGVAAGPVAAMLCAFAVGRLYLSGASPFRWHVGLAGPVAAAVEAISRALGPQLTQAGQSGWIFAMTVCSHGMLLTIAWLQYHQRVSGRPTRAAGRKRPYSLMPYVALAVTS